MSEKKRITVGRGLLLTAGGWFLLFFVQLLTLWGLLEEGGWSLFLHLSQLALFLLAGLLFHRQRPLAELSGLLPVAALEILCWLLCRLGYSLGGFAPVLGTCCAIAAGRCCVGGAGVLLWQQGKRRQGQNAVALWVLYALCRLLGLLTEGQILGGFWPTMVAAATMAMYGLLAAFLLYAAYQVLCYRPEE